MKKLSFLFPLALLLSAGITRAELKPGANLEPYEIHNTASGDNYCQMCAFSSKPATVAAYGKMSDAQFWADLEKLQAIHAKQPELGVFAQVLDSTEDAAIQAEAKKHGLTFPVVVARDADWNVVYKVDNVSRTVYCSQNFKITWSNVGLDDKAVAALEAKLPAEQKS